MRFWKLSLVGLVFSSLLACLPASSLARHRDPKNVSSYDGGLTFQTDGSLPNGACFRISGRATAPHFFDGLKRVDDDNGTIFFRGTETLTHFPDRLLLFFRIHDIPCSFDLRQIKVGPALTPEMLRTLHMSLYWKRGVDMRPLKGAKEISSAVLPVIPYATSLASDLPEHYEWTFDLLVPSAGVPLTDDLVLVFRGPDGRIAARVAARM